MNYVCATDFIRIFILDIKCDDNMVEHKVFTTNDKFLNHIVAK